MLVEQFAAFAVASRAAPLPEVVGHAAARALVDWTGVVVSGSTATAIAALRAAFAEPISAGGARLVPGGERVSVRTAALVNGAAAHVAELDDIYNEGAYHPGAPTIAAALAVAEARDLGGERLLRAIAVGYEIGCRVAAALQPSHYRYWHTTGTIGSIGAAAAVAELLELDVERFSHALASAATMAAGLQQAFRSESMSKPLHAGHAAETGVIAALAAEQGFTGALDVLEGDAGLGAAMSTGANWEEAIGSLGSPWCVTRMSVKTHACCGHTFAAVDAVLELDLLPHAVESVDIATYAVATTVAGIRDPLTPFEARFSIAYCVATAVLKGRLDPAAFEEPWLSDPAVRSMMAATTITVDPELDRAFPGRRGASVRVRLRDGSEVSRTRTDRRGDPNDPLADAEISDKATALLARELGDAAAEVAVTAGWNISSAGSVRSLVDRLCGVAK